MAWPFSLQSKILREFSGLEQGTSSTGAMVAVDVFCGWGNEILSTWSIVCPAMKHSWLLSLRELLKLQKTLSLSPLSGVGGEGEGGSQESHVLGSWTRCFVSLSLFRKTEGRKAEVVLGSVKKKAFGVSQVWVWSPALPLTNYGRKII